MLGIDSAKIVCNTLPHDTETEAKTYTNFWRTNSPVILVTSALHQRRAQAWFHSVGAKVIIGAPSDFLVKLDNPVSWASFIPTFRNLNNWDPIVKEFIGYFEISLK